MAASADIQRAFRDVGYRLDDIELSSRCADLATKLARTASAVANDYRTWAVQEGKSTDVTATNINRFSLFLQDAVGKENRNRGNSSASGKQGARPGWTTSSEYVPTLKRQATDLNGLATPASATASGRGAPVVTPAAKSAAKLGDEGQPVTPPFTSTKLSSRQDRGQVVQSINASLHVPEPAPGRQQCRLQLLHRPLGPHQTYMMEPVSTKMRAIEELLMNEAQALMQALPGETDDVDHNQVADVAQEPCWVVGRIVPEGEAGLNEASILLEGSRGCSGGARVRLDVSKLTSCRLFPGQAVCVKGLNPTGDAFIATELCSHLPAPRSAEVLARDVSLVVAAGPFSSSEDLAYEPLEELLRHCSERQPDVLLLLGPFVDVEHPAVREGLLERSYKDLFHNEVLSRLTGWLRQQATLPGARAACQVALMPAARDVHGAPVFPQPPLSSELVEGMVGKVTNLPNPSTFSCDGLVVSAGTSDVLKHLSGSEFSRGCPSKDRLSALAGHIIGQRSMYPLYPPHRDVPLDTCSCSHLQLPVTPDLLLLPSDLAPFARLLPDLALQPAAGTSASGKPANHTAGSRLEAGLSHEQADIATSGVTDTAVLALNPGRLTRGAGGGTFAHVMVVAGEGGLQQRCKVEIVKV